MKRKKTTSVHLARVRSVDELFDALPGVERFIGEREEVEAVRAAFVARHRKCMDENEGRPETDD